MSDATDDWDSHWSTFGDIAGATNPATRMRDRIILRRIGHPISVLDIGSGLGELACLIKQERPDTAVTGLEYSAEGVKRSQERATQRALDVRFVEFDLLTQVPDAIATTVMADVAVCSEVLEHVDDPARLLRNVRPCLLSGARLIVTVPGGPMSALDHHIGHRRHFTPEDLREVLEDAGYRVEYTARAGFPFFNLYRLLVIRRGQKLIADLGKPSSSVAARLVLRTFDVLFRLNLPVGQFGWQIVGVASAPATARFPESRLSWLDRVRRRIALRFGFIDVPRHAADVRPPADAGRESHTADPSEAFAVAARAGRGYLRFGDNL